MNCVCWPCDFKKLSDDDTVTISFELPDGSLVQSSKMFAREAEELLLNWLTD